MEVKNRNKQELDIMVLVGDFLRQAKRLWVLGLVLVLLCSAGMTAWQRRAYCPVYEAYASFTVRVANPLYASVSSYNERTAQVMADTFPSILTSGLLQEKVKEELGISQVPAMSVSAMAQSSILTLAVRDTDPQRAFDVLNAVIRCYPEVAELVVGSTELVLLDESGLPEHPIVAFSYRQEAIRGAGIGAGIWFVIVVLLALLKNTVHNEEELRRTLNTPCLGQIPGMKVSRKNPYPLLIRCSADSVFAESLRLLRLRVENSMKENGQKILLVSSAISNEGKSTVSVNLAVSMAQKGSRVLLIDCDLRNPSVAAILSSKSHPLCGENRQIEQWLEQQNLEELFQPTDVSGLFAVTVCPGKKTEDFGTLPLKQMAKLLRLAREQFDYVILDTPPCSMLSDAAELAELADAGLMVIRQDYASRDQILEGAQLLSECGLPIIGCAFNYVRKSLSDKYSYGYGYGYGYGGKSGQRGKS